MPCSLVLSLESLFLATLVTSGVDEEDSGLLLLWL